MEVMLCSVALTVVVPHEWMQTFLGIPVHIMSEIGSPPRKDHLNQQNLKISPYLEIKSLQCSQVKLSSKWGLLQHGWGPYRMVSLLKYR